MKSLILSVLLFFPVSLMAHEECFCWTKEKMECAEIEVQVAGPGTIQNYIQVAGKVIIHPDCLGLVIPKVSGSVCEIKKKLGELVEKDEILALIESKEIAEAKALYLAALKKYRLQQMLLSREQKLKGISAEHDYLQAECLAEEAKIALALSSQHLKALGFSSQEIEHMENDPTDLRFYALKAPLQGKILEKNVILGALVDSSSKAFTIGNLDEVMVEINVPQNDVQYLKEGLLVEITSSQGKVATAKICNFTPTINEETRSATALAVVENPGQEWSPGQFITAHIQTNVSEGGIVVPKSAIQMIKGQECLFVENGTEFIPSPVKLGKIDRQNAEVISGIATGTVYAASHTFCLKAEYEKEEGEHHH